MAFQKGQSGNPGGRPSGPRQQLTALLDERFPIAKRRKVIDLLVADASSDDWEKRKEARPLLLAYTFGKPTEYKEISGPEGSAIPLEIQRIDYRHGFAETEDGSTTDSDAPGES